MNQRDAGGRTGRFWRYLPSAVLLVFAAVLPTPILAQQSKSSDLLETFMGSNGKKGTKSKEYEAPSLLPALTPLPEPPRTVFDDCVLRSMQGVSSDTAARAVRASCEAKQVNAIAETRRRYELEFGPSISADSLHVEEVSVKSGRIKVILKNDDVRSGAMMTYARVSVAAPPRTSYGCKGAYRSYGLLLSLKSGRTVTADLPLHFPEAAGEPCVDVDMLRSKDASWSDSLKAATGLTVRPMDEDYLLPYTRRP